MFGGLVGLDLALSVFECTGRGASIRSLGFPPLSGASLRH